MPADVIRPIIIVTARMVPNYVYKFVLCAVSPQVLGSVPFLIMLCGMSFREENDCSFEW